MTQNVYTTLSQPIFIGNLMKSGASLLRAMISQHPNLFGSFETFWFEKDLTNAPASKGVTYLKKLFEVDDETFEGIRSQSTTSMEAFDRFMSYCTLRVGKKRWIDKSPDNIIHFKIIREQWPDMKFIHVVRDFRDTYASWKRSNKNYSAIDFVEKVKENYCEISDLIGKKTDQYLEVRHEDNILNAKGVMSELLNYLNEPWVDGIDKNPEYNYEYEKLHEVTGIKSSSVLGLKKPIFSDQVGQYKEILTEEEIKTIDIGLKECLTLYGYGS